MERSQFWGCQHTSIPSNPTCQAGLSSEGVKVGKRERSFWAIPGHQKVFTPSSWLVHKIRGLVPWAPGSLKALTCCALKLCHLLSQCDCGIQAIQPGMARERESVPNRATCCCCYDGWTELPMLLAFWVQLVHLLADGNSVAAHMFCPPQHLQRRSGHPRLAVTLHFYFSSLFFFLQY
jgi:hypothetical protein